MRQYCFQGHTHVPGIFTANGRFFRPADVSDQYELGDQKTMVNVGSVGQPRDGNPLASYVILEGQQITFRRVPYAWEETIEKIYAIPELDDFLGDRLREGR
jgi:diadenosine tetraphosphatase ApaH/serine/threonine PP2A family protein phosphatase